MNLLLKGLFILYINLAVLQQGVDFGEQSKNEGKDQESIQSSTTPDPGYQWESDNVTIRHHKREPRVSVVSGFSYLYRVGARALLNWGKIISPIKLGQFNSV